MTVWEILIISFGVSIDAFAVSIAGSVKVGSTRVCRNALLAAVFFGGFQIIMPLIGYFIAGLCYNFVMAFAHWIAFVLLAIVGGKMVWEGTFSGEKNSTDSDSAVFFTMLGMISPAIATSLDALSVGAGLRFANYAIWCPSLSMGVVTALVSACGVVLGAQIGEFINERPASIAAGCAIIGVGIKILVTAL